MLNKVTLIGRLTKDPELKYTPTGIAVARFTLAINRPLRPKKENQTEGASADNEQGSVTQEADFIRVAAWRRLGEICGEFLAKGRLIYIEGRLSIDSYEKDGVKRYISEVVADQMQILERKGTMSSGSVVTETVKA
jgi:single-strand DNA-binding protein